LGCRHGRVYQQLLDCVCRHIIYAVLCTYWFKECEQRYQDRI